MNQATAPASILSPESARPSRAGALGRIRVGMVGAGAIASTHAQTLSTIGSVTIAGVFDLDSARAGEFAGKWKTTAYPSLQSLLKNVDTIFICTFPQAHREAAVAAAEAGVHVLTEKPLARTVEDGLAIADAVNRSGITFMIAFPRRFAPGHTRLKEVVDSGALGKILSYWDTSLIWLPHHPPNWRTNPRHIMGATIESLSHNFDYMRHVVGDAVSAMGRVRTSRPDLDGYDNITSCILALAGGGIATIQSSWAGHKSVFQTGIIGSDASAVLEADVRLKRADEPEVVLPLDRPEDRMPGLEREVRYYIDCLKLGKQPFVGVADGVATLKISHAVLQSSAEGRSIDIV
jgi:predicted dehydrogenase